MQGYLLSGYVYYASGEYDMNWTTPQCILCLRMLSMFRVNWLVTLCEARCRGVMSFKMDLDLFLCG